MPDSLVERIVGVSKNNTKDGPETAEGDTVRRHRSTSESVFQARSGVPVSLTPGPYPGRPNYTAPLRPDQYQIGSVRLTVPPSRVVIQRLRDIQTSPVIRGQSIVTKAGQGVIAIDLTFDFASIEDLNNELLPILAELKISPFTIVTSQDLASKLVELNLRELSPGVEASARALRGFEDAATSMENIIGTIVNRNKNVVNTFIPTRDWQQSIFTLLRERIDKIRTADVPSVTSNPEFTSIADKEAGEFFVALNKVMSAALSDPVEKNVWDPSAFSSWVDKWLAQWDFPATIDAFKRAYIDAVSYARNHRKELEKLAAEAAKPVTINLDAIPTQIPLALQRVVLNSVPGHAGHFKVDMSFEIFNYKAYVDEMEFITIRPADKVEEDTEEKTSYVWTKTKDLSECDPFLTWRDEKYLGIKYTNDGVAQLTSASMFLDSLNSEEQLNKIITAAPSEWASVGQSTRTNSMPAFIQYMQEARRNRICRRAPVDPKKHKLILFYPNNFTALPGASLKDQTSFYKKLEVDNPEGESNSSGVFETGITTQVQVVWNTNLARQIDEWTGIVTHQFVGGSTLAATFEVVIPVEPQNNDHIRKVAELNKMFNTIEQNRKLAPGDGFAPTTIFVRNPITELFGAYCFELADMPLTQADPGKVITNISMVEALPVTGLQTFSDDDPTTPIPQITSKELDFDSFYLCACLALAGSYNRAGISYPALFTNHRYVSYPFAHLLGVSESTSLEIVLTDIIKAANPEINNKDLSETVRLFSRSRAELLLLYAQAVKICELCSTMGINENFPSVDLFFKAFNDNNRILPDDWVDYVIAAVKEAATAIVVALLFYGDDFWPDFRSSIGSRDDALGAGGNLITPLHRLYLALATRSSEAQRNGLTGKYTDNFKSRASKCFRFYRLKSSSANFDMGSFIREAIAAATKVGGGLEAIKAFLEKLGVSDLSAATKTVNAGISDGILTAKRAITLQLYPDLNLPTYAQIMRLPPGTKDGAISNIEKSVFIPSFSECGILNPSAYRAEGSGIYNSLNEQYYPHRKIHDIADPDFYFWRNPKLIDEIPDKKTHRPAAKGNIVDGGVLNPEFKGGNGILIADYNPDDAEVASTGQKQLDYNYDIDVARIERETEPNRRRMLFAYPTYSIEFFLDLSLLPRFDSDAPTQFKEAKLINSLPLISLSTRLDKSLAQIAEIQFVARKAGLFNESWQFIPPAVPVRTSTFTNHPEDMLEYLRSKKSFVGNPLFITNTLLTSGTRCTVRIGYGTDINNPRLLPVAVAGTIGEISLGEVSTIVVQSFGTQLINPIDADIGGSGRYSPNGVFDGSLTMRAFIDIFSSLNTRFLGNSGRGLENDITTLTDREVKRIFSIGYSTRTLGTRALNATAGFFDLILNTFGFKTGGSVKNFLTNPEWVFLPEMINIYPATTGVSDWAISNTSAKGIDATFWIDMISRLNPGTVWYPHNFGDEVRLFFGTPDQIFKAEPLPLSDRDTATIATVSQLNLYSTTDDIVALLMEIVKKQPLDYHLRLKMPRRYEHSGTSAENAVTRVINNFARRVGRTGFGRIARKFMLSYRDFVGAGPQQNQQAQRALSEELLRLQRRPDETQDSFLERKAALEARLRAVGVSPLESAMRKNLDSIEPLLSDDIKFNSVLARESGDEGFAETVLRFGRVEQDDLLDERTRTPILERVGIGQGRDNPFDLNESIALLFLIDALADTIEKAEELDRQERTDNQSSQTSLQKLLNKGKALGEQSIRLRYSLGYKRFRNVHFVASGMGLLENRLEASQARMTNHVSYNDYVVGYNVVPEERRVMRLDEDVNKLNFGIFEWLKGAFSKNDKDRVLDTLVPNALARGLSYMYDGEIIMRGDPVLKPHDIIYMLDLYNGVYGPVACQTVQHTINLANGFVTTVTPALHVQAFSNSALSDHQVANRILRNTAVALLLSAVALSFFVPYGFIGGVPLAIGAGAFAGLAGIHDTLGKLNLKNYSPSDPFVASASTKEAAQRLIESVLYDNFVPSGSPNTGTRNIRLVSPGEIATDTLRKLSDISTPQLGVSAFPLTRIGSGKPIVAGLKSSGLVDVPIVDDFASAGAAVAKQAYNDLEDFYVALGTIVEGTIVDAKIGISAAITSIIRKSESIERAKKALRDRGITGLD